ncbi:hypothetical protein G6F68_017803 [Rhizopus microsporus]|nr:hypothetical protein G6F68_017803 [Rhizopus microsporus]
MTSSPEPPLNGGLVPVPLPVPDVSWPPCAVPPVSRTWNPLDVSRPLADGVNTSLPAAISAAETAVFTVTGLPLSVNVPSVGRREMMTLCSASPSAPPLKPNSATVKTWLVPTSTFAELSAATGASFVPTIDTEIG